MRCGSFFWPLGCHHRFASIDNGIGKLYTAHTNSLITDSIVPHSEVHDFVAVIYPIEQFAVSLGQSSCIIQNADAIVFTFFTFFLIFHMEHRF